MLVTKTGAKTVYGKSRRAKRVLLFILNESLANGTSLLASLSYTCDTKALPWTVYTAPRFHLFY